MRGEVIFYLNGERKQVSGAFVFEPLSSYLRYEAGLTGTKLVCEEGDCGACTILIGRPGNGRLKYRAINSCIFTLYQADATHVVTVEGLAAGGLHPVQEAMVRCHGAQCGFCTPGFVMAMAGLCEQKKDAMAAERLSSAELRRGLTGNLCRCTGYAPIIEAGQSIDPGQVPALCQLFPEEEMAPALELLSRDALSITHQEKRLDRPADLETAMNCLVQGAVIVNGATDLGVQQNKGRREINWHLSLGCLSELQGVSVQDGVIDAGGLSTWTDMEEVLGGRGEFAGILSVFASPQIKNAGGMAGNIINGSPIADSLPYLMVSDAVLLLASPQGRRELPIRELYRGYKDLDLKKGEILLRIRIPLLADGLLGLYKVSRRRDLDISSFTAAIYVRLDGQTITEARVSLGGVAPVVARQENVERFLAGKPFQRETFLLAGDLAARSIQPLSDVRGSREYRLMLARNTFLRFYLEKSSNASVLQSVR
ncbi:MAG: FAD binding domain-containing protein [Spirochaetales bacterium]|nr:FAD binding domain-containing protein [Spirochaetales bacterium]